MIATRLPACLLLAGLGCAVLAAEPQVPAKDARFRSAIDLTTVNATVVSKEKGLITGLPREAFDVYEDGALQTITQFTNERVPVSLGILLDISDSMFGSRILEAREAIDAFVTDQLDPEDEFALLAFNHEPRPLSNWTSDRGVAARVMQPLKPSGATAINDAIIAALPFVDARNRQRAALLVISDGADTASDATIRDVRSALLRSDAFVYAIAIDAPARQPINREVNPSALREITDQSGGRTIVVQSTSDAVTAFMQIADELNRQYLIGYSSVKAGDGKFHSIRVRVRDTDYQVRARNGYVAVPRR
jgi:Ca-activated chloride channel family protein